MIERTDNPNLAILEIAVEALGNLSDSLVFVGGCAAGLLVTRVRVNQIRATKDVDVVTRVATIAEYHAILNGCEACFPNNRSTVQFGGR